MSSGRILIADDEPSVRDSVGYALAQEGFEVTGAADGDEASELLGNGVPYDLLILDIMMPGPSGLDICRDVRSRSAVPIIVLTAKDAEVDKVVGLEVGADDYVTKPFSVRELLGRVRAQLRRRELDRSPLSQAVRIESGPVAIDLVRHVATVRREPVNLTRSEFQLLRLLVGRPGEVFPAARSWRSCGRPSSTATRGPATSTSPTCARRWSAIRSAPSWSSPCVASATSSAPIRPADRSRSPDCSRLRRRCAPGVRSMDRMSRRPAPASLALGVMLLALAATAPAQAAPASAALSSPAQARGALRFWTPARMKRARPLAAQPAGGAWVAAAASAAARVLHETPHRYPSRAPAARSARASSTSQPVLDPTLPGNSQNGAIFISLGGGETARCSGTSVNAPNLSVVITAGHCVHDAGQWFDHRWVFVPGYHDGERPFGVFPAKWIGTTSQWMASADENFDVGAAVVSRNERGQRLAAAVGGDGIAWGLSPDQVFDVYGYPVAPPSTAPASGSAPRPPSRGTTSPPFSGRGRSTWRCSATSPAAPPAAAG